MTDRELLEAFLVEGRELVARAGDDLAALAGDPNEPRALESLFRSLHTLKGSTGLFDLAALTGLLHAAENRLEGVRAAGRMQAGVSADVTAALDLTEAWLDVVERGAPPGPDLLRETAGLAARFGAGGEARPAAVDTPEGAEGPPPWAAALAADVGDAGELIAIRYRPARDAYFRGDDPLAVLRGVPRLRAVTARLADEAAPAGPYDPFLCRLELQALSAAPEAEIRDALRLVADQAEVVRLPRRGVLLEPASAAAQTVRVSAPRLDDVAALVDELVIAKNALGHAASLVAAAAAGEPAALRELANRQASLERIVADLHGAVTDLRLVSLRALFARFPRHVRELAGRLGKALDFSVEGDDVGPDKSAVEALYEPLLHLIRNAVDHGVEAPDVRRAAGKPERARVRLSAQRDADAVRIEVADDGRGVDAAAVRGLAVARGLIAAPAAGGLSDADAARLIFAPGFSTARDVDELSGRGVGMDAVQATALRLGGRVELDNRPGRGLSVSLVLPARVVLAKVLVVEAAGQRFGVPLDAVAETHRLRADEVSRIREARAYVRRDEVIPILRLRSLLGLAEAPDPPAFPVLRLAGSAEAVAIQVDALGERMDAPLRPLSGLLSGYPGVLGSVLRGTGEVLLVLDLAELAA